MKIPQHIENALKKYGLTPEQIAVYLFLVQHGDHTPFTIAKETSIPRTTVYRILEELRNMGIVSIFKKNNVANYTPESPRRLLERLKEKENALIEAIPSIDSLFHSAGDLPHAKLYVGPEGVRTGLDIIYEYFEKHGLKTMHTYSDSNLSRHLPKYLSKIIAHRERLKIFTKLIAPESSKHDVAPHSQHYRTNDWREVRFMPDKFTFTGTMIMGGSMAVCFSLKDNQVHTIVLESESVVQMFIQFFSYTWDSLKK